MPTTQRQQRREALMAARAAVRAYAREPSAANARTVELAWQRVRELDSAASSRRLATGAALRLVPTLKPA